MGKENKKYKRNTNIYSQIRSLKDEVEAAFRKFAGVAAKSSKILQLDEDTCILPASLKEWQELKVCFSEPDLTRRPPTPTIRMEEIIPSSEARPETNPVSTVSTGVNVKSFSLKLIDTPCTTIDYSSIPTNDPRRVFYRLKMEQPFPGVSINKVEERAPYELTLIDIPRNKINYRDIPKGDPWREFYKYFS